MKLSLIAPLALPLAAALSSEDTPVQHTPGTKSWGTEKGLLALLNDVDVGEGAESKPSYCTMPPPNPACYRNDYPKCCTEEGAACPEQRPPCECDGDCVACTYPDADDCQAGEFCLIPTGHCRLLSATVAGTCAAKSQICTAENDPVCGCDGVTYGNSCMAEGAGVNVEHVGRCKNRRPARRACTYPGGDECGEDEFCMIPKGDCRKRVAFQTGVCAAMPDMCTYENDPTCGCDGNTYSSPCVARGSGVNVMHDGACRSDNVKFLRDAR